ncbi:GNAT family N-acetyltransferase [Nocardia terpenica]|uniref:GNAT family N-acetyltransferase n=1 Tax=Nocardia terpenica TaxID=455432 RepID=UPI001893AB29|nr:GNAT family N-acetyltransferase [Nocardia terpenica]MBF6060978.1 GNAT family N-acetyltransferase [Nocardia terpenica]MBF6108810.1 GNAT family N-acetyltransferase [Nocardia terpenica]MBF6114004.1 GNAT family N-acetyltransferase [Nocardia terpenica]MBF6120372.1 GNAT family N-acetyltransferase [Nocardia terpenica]MBF6156317.1 GNAT family N-acetyltransferase [Nocardia terpenica]
MPATGTEFIPRFEWRRLTFADFPLLARWLAQPHVRRWWNHEFTPEAVQRDFGPTARGEEPAEDLLVCADGEPVGLVQRCRLADYPEYLGELEALTEIPPEAVTIDYLIGDPDRTGRGLGSAMIAATIAGTWSAYPHANCIIVAIAAANRASWRALEKAGMRRVAEGTLPPAHSADDGHHYVYRVDRP